MIRKWLRTLIVDAVTSTGEAGCACTSCVMARANRRQAEMIAELTAERDALSARVAHEAPSR